MHRYFHAATASTGSTSARYTTPPLSCFHSDPRPGTTWNCPPLPNRPLQHDLDDKAQQGGSLPVCVSSTFFSFFRFFRCHLLPNNQASACRIAAHYVCGTIRYYSFSSYIHWSCGYMQARRLRSCRLKSRCQIPDYQWPAVPDICSPV
jgi:hypothetical protein